MAKQKKAYRPPYPLIEVVWDDAASNSETWVLLGEVSEPEQVLTVGYLVKETERAIVIANSVSNEEVHEETVGNTITIPKGFLVSRRFVRLETVKPKAKRKKTNAAQAPRAGSAEPDVHDDGAARDRKDNG